MLAGTSLRDDARLAHAPGQQRLSERVVDLVRAGMRKVLPLEEHADAVAARAGGEPRRLVHRRRAADVVLQQSIELGAERRVGTGREVAGGQLLDRCDEGFGHEAAAIGAEVSARIRIAPAEERWGS